MERVGILIYEDNRQLRESLAALLQLTEQFQVLNAFENYSSVRRDLEMYQPRVILMDIHLEDGNGIEAVKQIRQTDSQVQIIMLTVFDDDENVFAALNAGANGYLLKKHVSDKLVQAIRDVLDGGAPMSPAIARMVLRSFYREAAPGPGEYGLTPREKEILKLMAAGNSYKMIGSLLSISLDTVRSHIKHIYGKLQVHSQTGAVTKAINKRII